MAVLEFIGPGIRACFAPSKIHVYALRFDFFWVKMVQKQEIFGTKNGRFRPGIRACFTPLKIQFWL